MASSQRYPYVIKRIKRCPPDHKSKNDLEWDELIAEGRSIWTPRSVFGLCCVKWLVDGHLKSTRCSPRNGCDGRCHRDHPCITLQFDVDQNATIARLSRALDPFNQYFKNLVVRGLAKYLGQNTYFINDYLRPLESALRLYDGFGSHLVKVEDEERESSDKAQILELENDETREIEQRRIEDIDGVNKSLFEKASLILLNQPMIRNDLVTLQCLSSTCKFFRDEIIPIAARKVKSLKLSATLNLDGRRDCYLSIDYKRTLRIPLEFRQCGPDDGWYYPNDPVTVSYDSFLLDGDDYAGHLLQVYWHPDEADIEYVGEQSVDPDLGIELAEFPLPSCLGIELAEFPLPSCTRDAEKMKTSYEGTVKISCNGVTIECQEVENVMCEDSECYHCRYCGAVKLIRAKVDFGALVREHARQASDELFEEHNDVVQMRPLLTREIDYSKFLRSLVG